MPAKRARYDGSLEPVAKLLAPECKSATEYIHYPDPPANAEGGPVANSTLHKKSVQKQFQLMKAVHETSGNHTFTSSQAKG